MKNFPFETTLQYTDINELIHTNAAEYIKTSDRNYRAFVKNVANSVASDDSNKIVMLSGPSGSGKTTTAHFVEKYINELGKKAVTVSLDNFYLGKDKVPKLPDGRSDFESINALNVEEMTKCIGDLIKHGHCDMPEFDFVAGKREGYKTKPDPALTLLVIHSLGVAPAECILAGDSGMDMAAAVNAGALPVGVLWGFRTAEELRENGAEYLMSAPAEITELIGELNG